jgi:hypothetical protein
LANKYPLFNRSKNPFNQNERTPAPNTFKGSVMFTEDGGRLFHLFPSPSNSIRVSATPSVSITVTPSITPTITPTITVTPTLTTTPTITPSISVSVTPTVTVTPSFTPTITPTITVTPTVTITPTPSITPTTPSIVQVLNKLYYGVNSLAACVNVTTLADLAYVYIPSNANPFIINRPWYADSSLTTPYPDGYYALHDIFNTYDGYYAQISGGVVSQSGICPSPSPTPSITVTPTTTPSVTPSVTPSTPPSPTPSPSSGSSGGIVTSGLIFNLQSAPSSGATWTDASGNGYNATLQGSSSYTGSFGGGIKLNNDDLNGTDYIIVPYNINTSTVTVEVIASFNPTSFWGVIWGNEFYNSDAGYFAYMDSSTTINYGKPTSESSKTITASNAVRQWIFVINGTQASLFLNGSQVGSTDTISNQTLFATNDFYFGARHNNNGIGFGGDTMNNSNSADYPVFYQMRVYNKALSGSEITQNYNAIKNTYGL